MEILASDVLDADIRVNNRLVARTKPEVVERARELGFERELADTVSCWQIGRTRSHCGSCVPCLLRRIACETHGVADVPYDADLFDDVTAIDDPRARDNLAHLIAFVDEIREFDDVELEYQYPELLNGGDALPLVDAINLHRRWADQASAVLFSHPIPSGLR
jgi:hypothetical protein